MMTETMWAVQYNSYGGPEVLAASSAALPRPNRGEVLVEVAAFSINASDLLARQGRTKLMNGLGFPKGTGVDFAGTVQELGVGITDFRVGDSVWGYVGMKPPGKSAAAAQFLTIGAHKISHAPRSIPLSDAAALPLVGLVAVKTLSSILKVQRGQRVLVVGGNGGVGSTAVQVARVLGATVDAVTGALAETALQAGAERTYDYHTITPNQLPDRYEAIVDAAGKDTLAYRRLLKQCGRMAVVSPSGLPAILKSIAVPGPRIRMVSAGPNKNDLTWLANAVDEGKIKPLIAERYSVSEVVAAHRDFEILPTAGKRIVVAGGLT